MTFLEVAAIVFLCGLFFLMGSAWRAGIIEFRRRYEQHPPRTDGRIHFEHYMFEGGVRRRHSGHIDSAGKVHMNDVEDVH